MIGNSFYKRVCSLELNYFSGTFHLFLYVIDMVLDDMCSSEKSDEY
jgi:hypothetical protein